MVQKYVQQGHTSSQAKVIFEPEAGLELSQFRREIKIIIYTKERKQKG